MRSFHSKLLILPFLLLAACATPPPEDSPPTATAPDGTATAPDETAASPASLEGTATSADGVEIAYSVNGTGEPALVFVHGGFADRSFWSEQVDAFADGRRFVTLDLAGHGDSGRNRETWTLAAFGADVVAVADALELEEVILVGHSLGGPVILEAARLLGSRVVGLVAIDTLLDVSVTLDESRLRQQIEDFTADFDTACRGMRARLFPAAADPAFVDSILSRMCEPQNAVAVPMFEGFIGYDMKAALVAVGAPVRAINADMYPTNFTANREAAPDFDAVILEGASHYPMLEQPEEFNRHLRAIVEELAG